MRWAHSTNPEHQTRRSDGSERLHNVTRLFRITHPARRRSLARDGRRYYVNRPGWRDDRLI